VCGAGLLLFVNMVDSNVFVSFWGRVVDQNGVAIAGTRVRMKLRWWIGQFGVINSLTRATDGNGRFSVRGKFGDYLEIESIEKDGYLLSERARKAFRYSGLKSDPSTFTPDETQPLVYRMWKKQGAERMAHQFIGRLGIPCDGTPVRIDLVTGRKVAAGGDLQVTLVRQPLHIRRGKQHYDWTATFSAEAGGMIESSDEFMYVAPEHGYQPTLQFKMAADDPHWTGDKGLEAYLTSQNGKRYARMKVLLDTSYEPPPTGLTIEVWMNPNGSRNLEYDPALQIP